MAYCGKCGTKNPDGAAFCGACGAPLQRATQGASRTANRRQPKRGGKGNGIPKKYLSWAILAVVVMVLLTWLFKSCGGGGQDASSFERVMTDQQVDSLTEVMGFPQTDDDVAPLAGDYEVTAQGYLIKVTLKPEQDGNVVGKVDMSANGFSACVDGLYCYCGHSIYAIFDYDLKIKRNQPRAYFYALPDGKSIMMIDHGQYTLKRK